MKALAHVRSQFPFWNSSDGADHIWTFGYDEGASAGANPSWRQLVQTRLGVSWSKPILASAGLNPSWRQLVQPRLGVSWSKPVLASAGLNLCLASS